MAHIILCSGGARSGKSEFAEKLTLSFEGQKGYVATGQAFDDEMKDRIKRHQERRGSIWLNYEIPLRLHEEWTVIAKSCDVILVDDLTMITMNHIMEHGELQTQEDANALEEEIMHDVEALLDFIQIDEDKTIIFVTNELGLGIVPENKLARYFRDIAGRVNRAVADRADKMYLTISGVTTELKSQEVHING